MLPWLRQGASPYQTPLAMIGARSGDRLALVGAATGGLAAELARIAGLNGNVVVVDASEGAGDRVERAARRAGALVEFAAAHAARLPVDDADVDLVVFTEGLGSLTGPDRTASLAEARRVLKPGGRLIVIEGSDEAALFGLIHKTRPGLPVAEVQAALSQAGWSASRVLADTGGVRYVEAMKPR